MPPGHRPNNLDYNSALANSTLTFCKNVNAPEIMQAVEREQGAAAGPARTTRRWLRDMAEHNVVGFAYKIICSNVNQGQFCAICLQEIFVMLYR